MAAFSRKYGPDRFVSTLLLVALVGVACAPGPLPSAGGQTSVGPIQARSASLPIVADLRRPAASWDVIAEASVGQIDGSSALLHVADYAQTGASASDGAE